MNHKRSVVITGIGIVAPGVPSLQAINNLGRECICCRPIARFVTDEFRTKLAFTIEESHRRADSPRIVEYGEEAMLSAVAMADAGDRLIAATCVFGCAVGCSWEMEAAFGSLNRFQAVEGHQVVSGRDALSFSYPANRVFSQVASQPTVVTTGCTAGLDALGVGWARVLEGESMAVVVSAEAPVTPMVIAAFEQIGALTREVADEKNASLPFCVNRSGFCLGEGAAAVVLEDARSAQKRGVRPLGTLRSYFTAASAYHMTAIAPSGDAISRSIAGALGIANVDAADVGLWSPHATGTVQNDAAEHAACVEVFGANRLRVPLFCGKAHVGHALGASNLIEFVLSCAMLRNGSVAPYPFRESRKIEFDDLNIPHEPQALRTPFLVKNASGFAGIHSCVVAEVFR